MRRYPWLVLASLACVAILAAWRFAPRARVEPRPLVADELWEAVGQSKWQQVDAILEVHPRFVRGTDEHGRTLLHRLIRQAREDDDALSTLDVLTARGADVNAADDDGERPLHLAAEYGLPQIAERLLDADADPELSDARGRTPLVRAQEFRLDSLADIGRNERKKHRREAVAEVIERHVQMQREERKASEHRQRASENGQP